MDEGYDYKKVDIKWFIDEHIINTYFAYLHQANQFFTNYIYDAALYQYQFAWSIVKNEMKRKEVKDDKTDKLIDTMEQLFKESAGYMVPSRSLNDIEKNKQEMERMMALKTIIVRIHETLMESMVECRLWFKDQLRTDPSKALQHGSLY